MFFIYKLLFSFIYTFMFIFLSNKYLTEISTIKLLLAQILFWLMTSSKL